MLNILVDDIVGATVDDVLTMLLMDALDDTDAELLADR